MVSKRIAGLLLLLVACAALVSAPFVTLAQSPTPPPDALDIVVLVDDTGSMKGGSNSDNKQFSNRDPQEIRFDIANNLPQALKDSSLPDERIRVLGIKFTTDRLPSPAINLELQPVNTISNGLKLEYFVGDFEPVFQLALKALQCDSQNRHIGKAIVLLSDGYPQEEDNAKLLPSDALLAELKKCGVHVSFVRFTDSEFPDTKFEAQWKRVMSQISQNPSVQVQIFPVTRNMRKTDLETKAIPKKIVNQIEKSLSWNKAAGTNEAKQGGVVNTPLPTTTFVESTKSPVPTLTTSTSTNTPTHAFTPTSVTPLVTPTAPSVSSDGGAIGLAIKNVFILLVGVIALLAIGTVISHYLKDRFSITSLVNEAKTTNDPTKLGDILERSKHFTSTQFESVRKKADHEVKANIDNQIKVNDAVIPKLRTDLSQNNFYEFYKMLDEKYFDNDSTVDTKNYCKAYWPFLLETGSAQSTYRGDGAVLNELYEWHFVRPRSSVFLQVIEQDAAGEKIWQGKSESSYLPQFFRELSLATADPKAERIFGLSGYVSVNPDMKKLWPLYYLLRLIYLSNSLGDKSLQNGLTQTQSLLDGKEVWFKEDLKKIVAQLKNASQPEILEDQQSSLKNIIQAKGLTEIKWLPEFVLLQARLKIWVEKLQPEYKGTGELRVLCPGVIATSLLLDGSEERLNRKSGMWQANILVPVGFIGETGKGGAVKLSSKISPSTDYSAEDQLLELVPGEISILKYPQINVVIGKNYQLTMQTENETGIIGGTDIHFSIGKALDGEKFSEKTTLEFALEHAKNNLEISCGTQHYVALIGKTAFEGDREIAIDVFEKTYEEEFEFFEISLAQDESALQAVKNMGQKLSQVGGQNASEGEVNWPMMVQKIKNYQGKNEKKPLVIVIRGDAGLKGWLEKLDDPQNNSDPDGHIHGFLSFIDSASTSPNLGVLISLPDEDWINKITAPVVSKSIPKSIWIEPLDGKDATTLFRRQLDEGKSLTDLAKRAVVNLAGGHWGFVYALCEWINEHDKDLELSENISVKDIQNMVSSLLYDKGGMWVSSISNEEINFLKWLLDNDLIDKRTGIVSLVDITPSKSDMNCKRLEELLKNRLIDVSISEILRELLRKNVVVAWGDSYLKEISRPLTLRVGWLYYYLKNYQADGK